MSAYSIGVDLGGTNLRVGAFLSNGQCLSSHSGKTRLADGPEVVVADMVENVRALELECGEGRDLVGIGIGTPGPLELPAGILRNPPNLPGWDGFQLRLIIERTLGQHVILENDANVAALAEALFGTGQQYGITSLCMLTLGTGVGSGIVLNGRIWSGSFGMGGEAGHITVFEDGEPCGCGSHGCLEQYASATAICRMADEEGVASHIDGEVTAEAVAALAADHDASALRLFQRVGKSLGIALGDLINTLNLPLYVIGGGVAKSWGLFAPAMFEELEHRSYVYRLTRPNNGAGRKPNQTDIVSAHCGPAAGLLGAAMLPFSSNGFAVPGSQAREVVSNEAPIA